MRIRQDAEGPAISADVIELLLLGWSNAGEFETFERMAAWFGTGHRLVRYEPHLGGQGEPEIDGEHRGRRRRGGAVAPVIRALRAGRIRCGLNPMFLPFHCPWRRSASRRR